MKKDNIERLCAYLASTENWISASELALYLHTTARTVQNYIKQINMNSIESPLILSSAKGYRWTDRLRSSNPYILEHMRPEIPEERITFIVRNLLYRKNIDISFLTNRLSISERTLETDLMHIRELLRIYHMHLHIHKEHLSLSGEESERRRLIVYCIRQSGAVNFLTREYIAKSFSTIDVNSIETLLVNTLSHYALVADAYQQYTLLLYTIVQLSSIQKQKLLSQNLPSYAEIEASPDYLAAKEFAFALSNEYTFSSWEIKYLATLFLSFTKCKAITPCALPLWNQLSLAAKKGIQIAENYLHIDFTQDDFINMLTDFFMRMYIRQSLHLGAEHPLSLSLRASHPLLLDISAHILLSVNSVFPMEHPEQECGNLALLLSDYLYERFPFESRLSCTLVCPRYGGLVEKLTADLQNRLGNSMTINHIVDTLDIDCLPDTSEFTISLIPLSNVPNAVIISPLPKSEDYRLIRRKIHQMKTKRHRALLTTYFNSYMIPEMFELNHHFSSATDAIRYICRQLRQIDAIDDMFESEVLAREQTDTTAFHNLIALPHTCSSSVKRNSLYLILNREPITWGESHVNLIVLIAIQEDLLADFSQIYGLLINQFSNPKNIKKILQAKNYDSFLEILSSLEEETIE